MNVIPLLCFRCLAIFVGHILPIKATSDPRKTLDGNNAAAEKSAKFEKIRQTEECIRKVIIMEQIENFGLDDQALVNFGEFMRYVELPTETAAVEINLDILCGICLDLLHEPHWIDPCQHIFCEPCLRRLSGFRIVKCPICRQGINGCYANRGNQHFTDK